jgi:hypothetical protein
LLFLPSLKKWYSKFSQFQNQTATSIAWQKWIFYILGRLWIRRYKKHL